MKRGELNKRPPAPVRRTRSVSDTSVRRSILAAMALLGVAAFLVLAGRLVKLMLVDHDYYEAKAISNQTRSTRVTASRGAVYDRNMELLAASSSVETIFLDPLQLRQNGVDLDLLAKNLAPILDISEDFIKEQAADTQMRYKVLKRRQGLEVCNQVRAFLNENDITGVYLEQDSLRYYPNGSVASQLLGFTNSDNVGSEGLEAYYNKTLQGTAGAVITTRGNNETEMLYSFEKYYRATDGSSLELTLDLTVQRALEKRMKDAIDAYDVQNGAFGIVMNCQTGEIVAMATLGGYDPNQYLTIANDKKSAELDALYDAAMQLPEGSARDEALDQYNDAVAEARLSQWRNRCVSDGYEPGSTFKIITLASALDSGAVTLDDHFYCGGHEKFEGRSQVLNCWRAAGHGSETTAEALQNSCNLAFAKIGLKMGGETFYNYCSAFGLMETSGVDLPGEASGVFHAREHLVDTAQYGTSYLISTSFGQTVKVTPMQLVRAVSAVVNGGYLLKPYIVSQVLDPDGNVVSRNERTVVRQVISEATSQTMCGLLESVVTDGTASNGKVVGYRVGGKTGTAEKIDVRDENGQGTRDKIVSFVGVAPIDDPQYVVLIALDTPGNTGQVISGGVMAAPTVAAVFEDILPYLGVEPVYDEDDLARVNVAMPDVRGKTPAEARQLLRDAGLECRVIGSGEAVVSQSPAPGKEVPGGSTVLLYTDDSMPTGEVSVPELRGMTIEEATQCLNELGLYLQIKGSDRQVGNVTATSQELDPGTRVPRGTTVTVVFTDTENVD